MNFDKIRVHRFNVVIQIFITNEILLSLAGVLYFKSIIALSTAVPFMMGE